MVIGKVQVPLQKFEAVKDVGRQGGQLVIGKVYFFQVFEAGEVNRFKGSQGFVGEIQFIDEFQLDEVGDLVVFRDARPQLVEDFVSHFYCSSVQYGAGAVHGLFRRKGLRCGGWLKKEEQEAGKRNCRKEGKRDPLWFRALVGARCSQRCVGCV